MESFWSWETFWTMETLWTILGFLALGMFGSRFLIQWAASERAGHSVMPIGFWILSIAGGILLFSYSLYRFDWVFMVGQSTGLVVYFRNLYMIGRDRKRENRKLFSPGDFFRP